MSFLVIGVVLLGSIIGLFYFKGRLRKAWMQRLAYSEPIARLAVVAFVLILVGILASIGDLVDWIRR